MQEMQVRENKQEVRRVWTEPREGSRREGAPGDGQEEAWRGHGWAGHEQ